MKDRGESSNSLMRVSECEYCQFNFPSVTLQSKGLYWRILAWYIKKSFKVLFIKIVICYSCILYSLKLSWWYECLYLLSLAHFGLVVLQLEPLRGFSAVFIETWIVQLIFELQVNIIWIAIFACSLYNIWVLVMLWKYEIHWLKILSHLSNESLA